MSESREFWKAFVIVWTLIIGFGVGVWYLDTHLLHAHNLYYCMNDHGVRTLNTMYGQADYVLCNDGTIQRFYGNVEYNFDPSNTYYYW